MGDVTALDVLRAENARLTAEVVRLRRALATAARLASEGQTPAAVAATLACLRGLDEPPHEADSEGGEA